MSPWRRHARLAGRWRFRATFVQGWGHDYCMNQWEIHDTTARAMAWLSIFDR